MRIISLLAALIMLATSSQAVKYAGGDISLLPDYEKAGAKYKTNTGASIADLVSYSADLGMNVMRVRLFVNPADYTGSDADANACQTLDYILPLCQRIQQAGMALLLDFHYSDTWADPAKQYTPLAWACLSDEQLYEQIYSYTHSVLTELKENGVVPEFIQTGNEISYGMLWGPQGTPASQQKKALMGSQTNWPRFTTLLKEAGRACREVCPEAKIMIHIERTPAPTVLKNFYQQMDKYGVEYDIIGLSFYPYFHGDLPVLDKALKACAEVAPSKPVWIVETGYSYKWEVPGTTINTTNQWPLSAAGQNKFLTELLDLLASYPDVEGLVWWWPEYNAFGTNLSGWYNAPLFDSTTGRATSAFYTLAGAATSSVESLPAAADSDKGSWHDLSGRPVSVPLPAGIYVRRGEKILVR